MHCYEGYLTTAEALQNEAGVAASKVVVTTSLHNVLHSFALQQFEVADNMDLALILGEYEAYYEMKFDKKPKIVRKLAGGEEKSIRAPRAADPGADT